MSFARVFIEKKRSFRNQADALLREAQTWMGISELHDLRLIHRYDVEGVSNELMSCAIQTVFAEPPLDDVYLALPDGADYVFAMEYLPGQFDQRAESAAQCIRMLSADTRPIIHTAEVFLLYGTLTGEDLNRFKSYVINPVEAREADLDSAAAFAAENAAPAVRTMAMDEADLQFCQAYFRAEGREPTETEMCVIDTYWSDHCRHTTFQTVLEEITIEDELVKAAYEKYLEIRRFVGAAEKPVTLMDVATIGAKYLRQIGKLPDLDESEEINACSVKINVDGEPWLLMFKNETHNHPTEIEPFGGAATCIGGAIRDPLSGRAYVYQAMRVTGAGDPTAPSAETLPGKLPQRKLAVTAAAGFSAYGNQIGLATGLVDELYHPGYIAKRMEIGAVVGAAPASHVRRVRPAPGDVVILVGGRTGRDGIGGATGSSMAHDASSLTSCGAQVQKGNPPEERKLQRLFRDERAARLIKRCNDFGAGGVCVAVGELADGVCIELDKIPKKYEGLNATELAVSESQERMAVALESGDAHAFLKLCHAENLEATVIAHVTDDSRLKMIWRGETVVDISRAFINSAGARKTARATINRLPDVVSSRAPCACVRESFLQLLSDIRFCARRGLSERFDSTIGAGTVLMPYGGKYQKTPCQAMAAVLPTGGETKICTAMAYGFDPYLAQQNPFVSAYASVAASVSKLVAAGFSRRSMWLSFQEYFERLRDDPYRWGKPLAALLGALQAQLDLGLAAIGGKDSMSGSFEALDVPPGLISFACAAGASVDNILSPEFKRPKTRVALLSCDSCARALAILEDAIARKSVLSCWVVGAGGAAEGLCKMAFGNRIGIKLATGVTLTRLFQTHGFEFILELDESAQLPESSAIIGVTSAEYTLSLDGRIVNLAEIEDAWESRLKNVYPTQASETQASETQSECLPTERPYNNKAHYARSRIAVPKALIPVFAGTNCEWDTARALKRAGVESEILVIRNLSASDVEESIIAVQNAIGRSQMIVLPGGFSGGDEPEGSAKLILAFFKNPRIADATHELLLRRDGLMLGICNGFQALVKLGLLPFGILRDTDTYCPALTYNSIGRHVSRLAQTRVVSNKSPWFSLMQPGEIYSIPISHGEGRFIASESLLRGLYDNGQIAACYLENPNGSAWAIEAITSPDGRVLGKMGHTERYAPGLYKNVPGNHFQPLFEGGAAYFK